MNRVLLFWVLVTTLVISLIVSLTLAVTGAHAADFPSRTTTGVPSVVALVPSAPLYVTSPGTIIDGKDIACGVVIKADDVTIRNSRITMCGDRAFAVNRNGAPLRTLIEDTEIDGNGGKGDAIVCCGGMTLRRVWIHGAAEGPRAGSSFTMEDSLVEDLVFKDQNHVDAVQSTGGDGIRLIHNTLDVTLPEGNATFQFGEETRTLRNCLVQDNLMRGGNYTINGGGGGTRTAQCTFDGNQIEQRWRYGPCGLLGPGVVWNDTNTVRSVIRKQSY